VRGDVAQWGTTHFEVPEPGQSPTPVDQLATVVTLDAGISKEQALGSLRWIAEHIKKNGLPETTREVSKEYAMEVMKAQKLLYKSSVVLEELSARLQAWFYKYVNWQDLAELEEVAVEGNDHE
jgi:hypothetical protein